MINEVNEKKWKKQTYFLGHPPQWRPFFLYFLQHFFFPSHAPNWKWPTKKGFIACSFSTSQIYLFRMILSNTLFVVFKYYIKFKVQVEKGGH
tara:strand:- start:24238 stop:24513 length:276 start_codon:yes stop_codon:yes gene_type:complete